MGLSVNYKRERCVIISNGKCSKYIIQPEIKSTRENSSHSGDQGKSRLLTEFDENFIGESSFDCKSADLYHNGFEFATSNVLNF